MSAMVGRFCVVLAQKLFATTILFARVCLFIALAASPWYPIDQRIKGVNAMSATMIESFAAIVPSVKESQLASETVRRLNTGKRKEAELHIHLVEKGQVDEVLAVPASAMTLFIQLLNEIAEGNAVTLVPTHSELTTQQAADLLNVSRPYLLNLLEKGELPFHYVGGQRRVKLNDVMAYKQQIDAARLQTLDELAEQGQKLDMGY
jgi:excisionase family DNA binding protein